MEGSQTTEGPLAGVRITEFTSAWAGPYATCLLGFLGAEIVIILAASALVIAGGLQAAELETEQQKLSYAIGINIAQSLIGQGTEVDIDTLTEALKAKYEGGELAMTPEEAAGMLQAYVRQRQEAQAAEQAAMAEANKQVSDAFLAQNANAEGVMTTASAPNTRQ